MTNDFGNLWLQGTQIGAGIAGSAMDRNLRMQELRSQEAVRQLHERQIAQQMSMQLYQHNMLVDAQADRAKATAAMAADMMLHPATVDIQKPIPYIDQPDEGTPRETMSVPNPNGILPEDAYMKHVFPVDQKWQGILPGGRGPLETLGDYSRVKEARARAGTIGVAKPRTPEQIEADKALTQQRTSAAALSKAREDVLRDMAPERLKAEEQLRLQRESQIKLNQERVSEIRNKPFSNLGKEISDYVALRDGGQDPDLADLMRERIGKGAGFTPGAMQKNLDTIENYQKAGKLTNEQADAAKEIVFGLRAKESAAGEWMQRTEVTGLMKRRDKLSDSLVEKQMELDKLEQRKAFQSTIKKKQQEVGFIEKQIEHVNQDIDKFRPASQAGHEDEEVWVQDKNGKTGKILKKNLPEAIRRGGKVYRKEG